MTIFIVFCVMVTLILTREAAIKLSNHFYDIDERKNCQICSSGVPYILWYKEEVKRDTFCQYHRDQTYNIDELERNLLDTILIPLDQPETTGRYRNTYIKPLPVVPTILAPNEVREIDVMPYEEITVWDTGEVIRKVYHDTPARPRAIAAPGIFYK